MRIIFIFTFNLLFITFLYPQNATNNNQYLIGNSSSTNLYSSLNSRVNSGSQTEARSYFKNDSTTGRLLNDDPEYNKKYSIWHPVPFITAVNVITWGFDRYVLNASYARVGLKSWENNFKHGWVWDIDRFGVDFLGHPISGAMFFNAARSSGYNFVQSYPYALFGSLEWKYFGENDLPTTNDIITSSVAGSMYGEMLYRFSSNILDDRKTGSERVFREIFAGIVDPVRGVNRLIQGRSFRVTSKEVYEKEPLQITIGAGAQKINNGTSFGTGGTTGLINLSFVYGDPFEDRDRKPFDYFETNIVLSNGDRAGKSICDNISAYGILFGENDQTGNMETLMGIFQHYDYFNNKIFELGNITFSGGILTKLPVGQKSFLYTNFHLGILPFGGYSIKLGPDTASVRDFNYGGGASAKLESTFDFHHFMNLNISAQYYWMNTYTGIGEHNLIGIINPTILFRVYKNIQVGFQYFLYTNYMYHDGITSNLRNSEQKLMLLYNFGDSKSSDKPDKAKAD